jgi:hypothetical protein
MVVEGCANVSFGQFPSRQMSLSDKCFIRSVFIRTVFIRKVFLRTNVSFRLMSLGLQAFRLQSHSDFSPIRTIVFRTPVHSDFRPIWTAVVPSPAIQTSSNQTPVGELNVLISHDSFTFQVVCLNKKGSGMCEE